MCHTQVLTNTMKVTMVLLTCMIRVYVYAMEFVIDF